MLKFLFFECSEAELWLLNVLDITLSLSPNIKLFTLRFSTSKTSPSKYSNICSNFPRSRIAISSYLNIKTGPRRYFVYISQEKSQHYYFRSPLYWQFFFRGTNNLEQIIIFFLQSCPNMIVRKTKPGHIMI